MVAPSEQPTLVKRKLLCTVCTFGFECLHMATPARRIVRLCLLSLVFPALCILPSLPSLDACTQRMSPPSTLTSSIVPAARPDGRTAASLGILWLSVPSLLLLVFCGGTLSLARQATTWIWRRLGTAESCICSLPRCLVILAAMVAPLPVPPLLPSRFSDAQRCPSPSTACLAHVMCASSLA